MAESFESVYKIVFFSVLVLLGLVELAGFLRRQKVQRETRWTTNIGMYFVNGVIASIVLPVSLIAFAMAQPPGLMAQLNLGTPAEFLLTFLILDVWRYGEHRLYHRVPLLWRAHRVHHSDTQIDVTTTERHHPFEVLLGSALMLALVTLLGLPAGAMALYFLVAVLVALFSHANVRLPLALDRWLRLIIVTPAVHFVHHSASQAQTDSNYANVLTIWDRLFGTYTDPDQSRVANIGLEYFHQPPDTSLLRVLQQPFLFGQGVARSAHTTATPRVDKPETRPAPDSPPALSAEWRTALTGATIGSALALLVLWPTALELATLWQSTEAYRYAWMVVPMLVYLLGWHFRQEILALKPRPDFTGVVLALLAAACWGAAELLNIGLGKQFGLVLALQAIAMSALGWRLYFRLLPVLALLFMAIPNGDLLQPVLRLLTVKSIDLFATVAGLPHSVDGFFIFIGKLRYVVVDACSGLAYVNLTFFLGYCFGLLLFRSFFKVLGLALFAACLGVVSNVLRVNAIVLIDWFDGTQMDLAAHGNVQWLALCLALALLFYVLMQLKPDPAPALVPQNAAPRSGNQGAYAPVAAGLLVLLVAGVAAWLPANAIRPPYGTQTEWFPEKIEGWTLVKPIAAWSTDRQSDTESVAATYQRGGQEMRVVVVETLSAHAKLAESRLSPTGPGTWSDLRTQKEVNCVASTCLTLWHTTWQRGRKYLPRHVFYAYSIGALNTESKLVLRANHALNRLAAVKSHPRMIGLTFEGTDPPGREVAAIYLALQAALNTTGK